MQKAKRDTTSRKLIACLGAISFALIANIAICAERNVVTSAPAPAPAPEPSQEQLLQQQITILKANLENAQKFSEQTLQTVYWALGSVLTLTVLLVGYGWLVNFKVYERDKELLKEELIKLIADVHENTAKDAYDELDKKLADSLTRSLASMERKFTKLQTDSQKFRLELTKKEVNDYIQKDNYAIAVTRTISWLDQAIKLELESEMLDAIHSFIQSVEKGGSFIPSEIAKVTALFDGLPKSHAVLKDKALALLANAKIL